MITKYKENEKFKKNKENVQKPTKHHRKKAAE
jgi:hypothetical protein